MNAATSIVPFAHLGHWYVQLAFATPAMLAIALVARDSLRRRRRGRKLEPERSKRKPE